MQPIRIAVGGFIHETNTFSPVQTRYEDFQFLKGSDLIRERLGEQVPANIEVVPTLFAESLPSGLVAKESYLHLKEVLVKGIEDAMPLAGIYLDLHGAMEVEEIGDAEGDFAASVRRIVGPETVISVSLDLHGNISPKLVNSVNILTAYRTAPHRDMLETRLRAFRLLVESLQSGKRPVSVLVKLPLLLPGESAVTEVEPAKTLFNHISRIEGRNGILDASLLIGCAWTDSADTGASVIVVAEDNGENVMEITRSYAMKVWNSREDFKLWGEVASIDEAIQRALSSKKKPVFISDSGDNVTAGAAGDIPLLLERLIAHDARDALVAGLTDPEAVEACAIAGQGSGIDLEIGGKIDTIHGQPFKVHGKVEHITREKTSSGHERAVMVLLNIDGIRVILLTDRRFLVDRRSISVGGIDPMTQQIVVVKQGYLFPDLYDHAPHAIMALSPGSTDLQLERLDFVKIHRPIFPLEKDTSWNPINGSLR
jgi:microcystin degradation protein MlrC